jgi:hypothetical protein
LNVTFNGDLSIYPGQFLQPAGMRTTYTRSLEVN